MTKVEQVRQAVVRLIESGALREGDRLPSEEELAARHAVSVGTMQKALARLAQSGVVSREHGRGTFVSGRAVAPAEIRYLRFRDVAGHELPQFVHVRSVRRVGRAGRWSEILGGESFVCIERTINVGPRLELYSEFWLRDDDFARLNGVQRSALERNLRALLGQRLALPTLRAEQWLNFGPLPAKAARRLGLAAESMGMVMELVGHTLEDRPLYYQRVCSGPFSEQLEIVR